MILIFFLFSQPRNVTGFSSFQTEDTLSFGKISISGKSILSKKEIEKLLPEAGMPFSQEILEEHINRILKFYVDRGFPFAKVFPMRFRVDSRSVSFELYIEPGHIQKIKKVIFKGNKFTKDEFLLRQIPLKYNAVFNEEALEKSIKGLEKLDYIEVDSFQIIKSNEEGCVSLLLYISEVDRGNLIGAISYSKNGGWSGKFSAENKNLFGSGRSIELKWMKEGNIYQEEFFKYTEPYILSLPLSLAINIQHSYIENISNRTSISTGISYSMKKFTISVIPGIENYAQSGEGSNSYPFFGADFFYNTNLLKFSYRNKWKREGGWIMEVSSSLLLFHFNIDLEYFVLTSREEELLFFKPIRGYPGVTASRGLRLGIEWVNKLGQLVIYPLLDTSWIQDSWRYSYGIGIKVNKVSLEYAIPFDESAVKGRVYITFNGFEGSKF